MATRFLVSSPSPDVSADVRRQWDRFCETLRCAGDVELVVSEGNEPVPELVFTASAGFISGTLAVVSTPRHPQRRRGQGLARLALARAGCATTYLQQTYFEGASDALYDRVRPLCYAGYGWRSERAAMLQLQEILSCRVLPLLLTDERFFHLDRALCPLGSGHVMVYLDAFSPAAQTQLRRTIEPAALIELDLEDALGLACGAVEIGDGLVLPAPSRKLRERLNAAGYTVFSTDLDAFTAAGGSPKAMTLRLDDGPVGLFAAASSA